MVKNIQKILHKSIVVLGVFPVITGFLTTSDNKKIAYDHYQNGHEHVVIIAHGFFNSKQALLIKELAASLQDDYDVITFDFRGHGKSSGLFSWTSKEAADLEAILEYASAKYNKIGIIAFSLGAAISIEVTAKSNIVDSFIAVSAPTDFQKIEFRIRDLDTEQDIFYNLKKGRIGKGVRPGPFWLKKPKPIELVGKIKCPILYIHGDNDWVINYKHSLLLFGRTHARKDIKIIKNGPHAEYLIRKNKKEVVSLIKVWFRKTLTEVH